MFDWTKIRRLSFLVGLCATAPASVSQGAWPGNVEKVQIPCSDGATQPAMWYTPADETPKPLLVGLHTWSTNWMSADKDAAYADWCIKQGWAFIHPDFRGPNKTPLSMGSDRAVQDIVEAVAWAQKKSNIDPSRIYLIGVSGGGHMALQMAGRHPELWAGVSAWCGISDIAQWHSEHVIQGKADKYAQDIEAALGGSPASNPAFKNEAWKRSPLSSLASAKIPLDINHGVHDGRKGSVPFSHSLRAFNAAVPAGAALDPKIISEYYETQVRPSGWGEPAPDPVYGKWKPVFRATEGNTRVTLFEGGHEIVYQAALNWLALQRKDKPANWDVSKFIPLETAGGDSGK